MSTQVGPAVPDTSYQPLTHRPTRKRYIAMLFIGALAFLTYFDRVCIAWAGEYIQKDLSLSDRQMGIILGVFWFAYALFEIPGGWLADRYGARKALARTLGSGEASLMATIDFTRRVTRTIAHSDSAPPASVNTRFATEMDCALSAMRPAVPR